MGLGRSAHLEKRARAAVDDVPPYACRTPLQRSIQILKRHRDVMFTKMPQLAPISMIITNLAAHAYSGEQELAEALVNIVMGMERHVRANWPKVPNPTHPAEDYADKWRLNRILEQNFFLWLEQLKADVLTLTDRGTDAGLIEKRFSHALTSEQRERIEGRRAVAIGAPLIIASKPVPRIESASKPWGDARTSY